MTVSSDLTCYLHHIHQQCLCLCCIESSQVKEGTPDSPVPGCVSMMSDLSLDQTTEAKDDGPRSNEPRFDLTMTLKEIRLLTKRLTTDALL